MTSIIHEAKVSQTMSVSEAAEMLSVSKHTLYRQINAKGEIAPGVPVLIVGTRRRIPRERFMRWFEGRLDPSGQAS